MAVNLLNKKKIKKRGIKGKQIDASSDHSYLLRLPNFSMRRHGLGGNGWLKNRCSRCCTRCQNLWTGFAIGHIRFDSNLDAREIFCNFALEFEFEKK